MKKEIEGLPRCYLITSDGKIINGETGYELKQLVNRAGYYYVQFTINGKHYSRNVHRLIAEAFIPNPEHKPYINHIDGNRKNNAIENLEWCTAKENTDHAAKVLRTLTQYQKYNENHSIPVQGTYPDGSKTAVYPSMSAASKAFGIKKASMINHIHGRRKTCAGAVWTSIRRAND